MAETLAHRGPDGQDLWLNHESEASRDRPQCGLAFRRLAILDPDPRSMQPMTDGRRRLVFNGEIYNFRDLRAQLDAIAPQEWKTTGDSETLLRAFALKGEKCLGLLNGMFAFAVWDQQTGTLFLARDRMGQKPLYFAFAADRRAVAFASELAALRLLDWPDFSVDPVALTQYLRCGYISAPATIYNGVAKLPPGNFMSCPTQLVPAARVYFDPNAVGDGREANLPPAPEVPAVREAVLTAVRRQLISDVPLGCWLSGGIDSSIIAAAMKSAMEPSRALLTFSIGFEDSRYDETQHAAEVAKYLGTEHREFIVRPDAAADLPKLAAVFGEPFADSSALPTHYLAQQTAASVKVALSGDGGDELFGGYDRYRAMNYAIPAPLRPLLRAAAALTPGSHPKSAGARFKRYAAVMDLPPHRRYAAYTALFDLQEIAWLQYGNSHTRDLIAETYQRLLRPRDPVQAALATDRVKYLPEDLMTKVDRASMLHGLEVRSPFLDHELVQLAAGLTTRQLLNGRSKGMLRQAFGADLPASVFNRPKMGFAVPIGDWLRDSLRPMMNDLLTSADSFAAANFDPSPIRLMMEEHQTQRADHSQRLYGLVMLELWWRQQRR
jgi:asparagine synthase (glutamine-hydrolysing)